MFIFSVINYHRLLEAIPWIYGFCLVSLIAVLAVGNPRSWGRGAGSSFLAGSISSHPNG